MSLFIALVPAGYGKYSSAILSASRQMPGKLRVGNDHITVLIYGTCSGSPRL